MQRAVILIVVMVLIGVGAGIWMERGLLQLCWQYQDSAWHLRQLVEENAHTEALQKHAYLFAEWQGDQRMLKMLISHHHVRAVDEALRKLTTTLENGWSADSLLTLDSLDDALEDMESEMRLCWENVL